MLESQRALIRFSERINSKNNQGENFFSIIPVNIMPDTTAAIILKVVLIENFVWGLWIHLKIMEDSLSSKYLNEMYFFRKNLFSISFAILGIVQFNFNNPSLIFCFSLVLYISFNSLLVISPTISIAEIICRYCIENILPLLIRFKNEEIVCIELLSNSKPRIQQLRDKCQSYN